MTMLNLSKRGPIDQIETWQAFAPELGLCAPQPRPGFELWSIERSSVASLEALLVTDGYFQLDSLRWGLPIDAMAAVITRLRQHGLSTAFAFLYDEFWLIFAKMHNLLAGLLGDEYRLLPDFWAWYIDHRVGEPGWSPHRDRGRLSLLPDGRPRSLTVWLPLTDATPLNGCMYLVPPALDRHYNTEAEDDFRFDFPDVRALPAPAGSLLCWNQALLHWGGRSSARAAAARISIAFEFQRGDEPPFNQPQLRPLQLPRFQVRLLLVCKQILQYKHMYPLDAETETMATAILAAVP